MHCNITYCEFLATHYRIFNVNRNSDIPEFIVLVYVTIRLNDFGHIIAKDYNVFDGGIFLFYEKEVTIGMPQCLLEGLFYILKIIKKYLKHSNVKI